MKTAQRFSFGIDISKKDFTVTCAYFSPSKELKFSRTASFNNKKTGFNQFLKWSRKIVTKGSSSLYIMEATGIYYEPLAYHLNKLKKEVVVLLANKVKYYSKSLNVKTKTDAVDSKVIAQFGLERKHRLWTPPNPVFKQLREYTRLLGDLKKEKTAFKNRIESVNFGESVDKMVKSSLNKIIKELDKQIHKCEQAIEDLINSNSWLKAKVEKLETIKGVGLTTIAIIIAETQGFEHIRNRRQLASYSGFDVVKRESGTSVKGKTRISKKGNSRIRTAMYFPALVASRHNKALKEDYQRIIKGKSSKKIGITALQRKLLLLMYTIWKNDDIAREDVNDNFRRKGIEAFPSSLGEAQNIVGSPEATYTG